MDWTPSPRSDCRSHPRQVFLTPEVYKSQSERPMMRGDFGVDEEVKRSGCSTETCLRTSWSHLCAVPHTGRRANGQSQLLSSVHTPSRLLEAEVCTETNAVIADRKAGDGHPHTYFSRGPLAAGFLSLVYTG